MKILLINPNENKIITENFLQRANYILQKLQLDHVVVHATNAHSHVAVITTENEVKKAETAVSNLIDSCIHKYDKIVICAFSDPALLSLRKKYGKKIHGIGYDSIAMAYKLSNHFAILTGQQSIVSNTCRQVEEYHMENHFDGVIAIDKTYEETLRKKETLYDLYLSRAREFINQHGTEVILLGGAVFTGWSDYLSKDLGVKVIEGVDASLETVLLNDED